jgi:hypothetical protein
MVTLCGKVTAAHWSPAVRMRTHAERTHQYSGRVDLQAGVHDNTD